MKTISPSFYNQVFANQEQNISPKSREIVLVQYFQKYLPSFYAKYPDIVEQFISGNISYEDMLEVFMTGISDQTKKRFNRIFDFDRKDVQNYGPRSLAPIPSILMNLPLESEIQRFKEVFGNRKSIDVSRVPGTQGTILNSRRQIQSLGAW